MRPRIKSGTGGFNPQSKKNGDPREEGAAVLLQRRGFREE
jgi:hypothetical protein